MSYIITALIGLGVGLAAGLIFASAAIRNNKERAAKLSAELDALIKALRK
jgi:hypothetical protein